MELTVERLRRRLINEEKLLKEDAKDKKYSFIAKDVWEDGKFPRGVKKTIPTVYGPEVVPVVKQYTINFPAKGYIKPPGSTVPKLQLRHTMTIHILRTYPFKMDAKLGAPIRVTWVSDIFHPNIAPGIDYGGPGVFCLGMIEKWLPSNYPIINLPTLIRVIKCVVENPNPDDPIGFPTCREAAEWFKKHASLLTEKNRPVITRIEKLEREE